ncbi:MAG: hypothetical protein P4L10_14970 [Acidobacteriaceae bacterium]|nr:hypothetical protein [Acidobacteriaceae bacterium]
MIIVALLLIILVFFIAMLYYKEKVRTTVAIMSRIEGGRSERRADHNDQNLILTFIRDLPYPA